MCVIRIDDSDTVRRIADHERLGANTCLWCDNAAAEGKFCQKHARQFAVFIGVPDPDDQEKPQTKRIGRT
jgi:hypothetical protein